MKRTRKQRQQERAQVAPAPNVPAKAETSASAQAVASTEALEKAAGDLVQAVAVGYGIPLRHLRCEVAGRAELSTVRAELVGLKVV